MPANIFSALARGELQCNRATPDDTAHMRGMRPLEAFHRVEWW